MLHTYRVRLGRGLYGSRFSLHVGALNPTEARAIAEWARPGWKAISAVRSPYALTLADRNLRERYLASLTPAQ